MCKHNAYSRERLWTLHSRYTCSNASVWINGTESNINHSIFMNNVEYPRTMMMYQVHTITGVIVTWLVMMIQWVTSSHNRFRSWVLHNRRFGSSHSPEVSVPTSTEPTSDSDIPKSSLVPHASQYYSSDRGWSQVLLWDIVWFEWMIRARIPERTVHCRGTSSLNRDRKKRVRPNHHSILRCQIVSPSTCQNFIWSVLPHRREISCKQLYRSVTVSFTSLPLTAHPSCVRW